MRTWVLTALAVVLAACYAGHRRAARAGECTREATERWEGEGGALASAATASRG